MADVKKKRARLKSLSRVTLTQILMDLDPVVVGWCPHVDQGDPTFAVVQVNADLIEPFPNPNRCGTDRVMVCARAECIAAAAEMLKRHVLWSERCKAGDSLWSDFGSGVGVARERCGLNDTPEMQEAATAIGPFVGGKMFAGFGRPPAKTQ